MFFFLAAAVKVSDDMASPTLRYFSAILSKVAPRLPVQFLSHQVCSLTRLLLQTRTAICFLLLWPQVSRNPAVVEQYQRDQAVAPGPLTARWGNETINATLDLLNKFKDITLPLLVIHGKEDVLVNVEAAHLLYESISSDDKTIE